jgi:hypothetical protein
MMADQTVKDFINVVKDQTSDYCEQRPPEFPSVYQYLDPRGKLVFRYDNTGHHKKLGLSTYPHHKHTVSKDRVFTSNAPGLADVLKEIESHIVFS